jgi:hypothetical protein
MPLRRAADGPSVDRISRGELASSHWKAAGVTDLYLGLAVVVLVSVSLFVGAARLGRRLSPRAATTLAVPVAGFLLAWALWLDDGLWLARVLPVSNLVVVGDTLPPAAALLAGLAWRAVPGSAGRKSLLLVPLLLLSLYRAFGFLFAAPPLLLADRWNSGVCLQTSQASCGAAAAATMLKSYGIDATESEMARLCLTREAGTSLHGLYRGLKLKTADTPWAVEPFHTDAAGLRRMRAAQDGPMLLCVRLERGADTDPRYAVDWGWTPGVNHTVVVYRFTTNHNGEERIEIGDPAVGREFWDADALRVLWHGEGLRLVSR